MIRVLTISKPYVGLTYRNKLKELADDGRFDIGLICPDAWGTQTYEVAPKETKEEFWTERLSIRLNGKNHFHTYKKLEQAIKDFSPDVLNVEEEHYSVVTWQAYRIAKKLGIKPIFYTWQNLDKKYPPPFCWIEDYIFRNSAGGVAGNQEAADILHRKGYKGPLKVIPQMGVDYESFKPKDFSYDHRTSQKTALGLDPSKFWVLFAGRIVHEKGIQDLMEAIRMLNDPSVAVLVIGDGPYCEELKGHSQDLVEKGQVKFLANVESRKIPAYLQAADVMCLPSRTEKNWKEQFGRIIVESMAAGAVVMGSDSGEIPKVIGEAGVVVKERNPESIKCALAKLVADPELCKNLRAKATERVKTNFTNKVIARQFGDFFAEIAAT